MELVAVAHPVVEVQLLPVEGKTYWGHEHLLEVEGLLVVGRNHLQEEEVHLQVVVVQNHHRLEEVGLVV